MVFLRVEWLMYAPMKTKMITVSMAELMLLRQATIARCKTCGCGDCQTAESSPPTRRKVVADEMKRFTECRANDETELTAIIDTLFD